MKGSSGWRAPFSRCGTLNKNVFRIANSERDLFFFQTKIISQPPPVCIHIRNEQSHGGEKLSLDPRCCLFDSKMMLVYQNFCVLSEFIEYCNRKWVSQVFRGTFFIINSHSHSPVTVWTSHSSAIHHPLSAQIHRSHFHPDHANLEMRSTNNLTPLQSTLE